MLVDELPADAVQVLDARRRTRTAARAAASRSRGAAPARCSAAAPCTAASPPTARAAPRRGRGAARRTCTASRAARRSRAPGSRCRRAARSAPRRPTRARRPRARSRRSPSTGVIVPTAFEASGNATTFVRSGTSERRWSRSIRHSPSRSASFTTTPLSSRDLEPRRDVRVVVELRRDDLVARLPARATPCARGAKLSDVMFAPNVDLVGQSRRAGRTPPRAPRRSRRRSPSR